MSREHTTRMSQQTTGQSTSNPQSSSTHSSSGATRPSTSTCLMSSFDGHGLDMLAGSFTYNIALLIEATARSFTGSDLSIIQSLRSREGKVSASTASSSSVSHLPPSSPGSSLTIGAASNTGAFLSSSTTTIQIATTRSTPSRTPNSLPTSPSSSPQTSASAPICSI